MKPHTTYDASLALAAASFVTVVGSLSVSTYDWCIVTGVAILCADIPVLAGFARWIPPDLQPTSTWHDWIANHLFLLAMPCAVLGMSFIFAHVHILCGVLFALFSVVSLTLYYRRLAALGSTNAENGS